MNVQQALAPRAGKFGKVSARIALHRQDRMRHQRRLDPLLGDFGKGAVEQERHVVVDHLEHGDVARRAGAGDDVVDRPDTDMARRARLRQVRIGAGRQMLQILGE